MMVRLRVIRMGKVLVIHLAAFLWLLGGCSTSPNDYHPSKALLGGRGYKELDLQYGVYYIEYKGDEDTTPEKNEDYVLLRAAELAVENGYPYFMVRNHRTDMETEEDETRDFYEKDCVFDECDRLARDSYDTAALQIPISRVTIACFKEKPADVDIEILDAHGVRTKIRRKYGLTRTDGSFV